jgi:hypothetical protein
MTIEQSLATAPPPELAPVPDADVAREPSAVAWWGNRTAEELRDIINRGFAGGQQFRDAVAEAERRASEETKRLRAIAAHEALSRTKRRKILWGAAASMLIIAVLGFWIAS